jgi:hypothetical protein
MLDADWIDQAESNIQQRMFMSGADCSGRNCTELE